MAARPTWKGHMKISLVTVPVQMFAGTNSAAQIRFNRLHRECGSRIKQRNWCESCDAEVARDEAVKGYEYQAGRYVTLEETEIEQAKPESSRIIQITHVADDPAVDPMYVERPYYLAPDGDAGRQAFSVIREALAGKTGYGTVAMARQEYPVAIQARGPGIVMLTLRKGPEVRDAADIPSLEDMGNTPSDAEVALARQVLETLPKDVDMSAFQDRYRTNIKSMIDAKIAGTDYAPAQPAAPAPVEDLMAALKRSLATAGKTAA